MASDTEQVMTHDATELVRLAQAEAPGAMDRLCDTWLPVVLGWCTRLGGSKVHAEDATHDVFLVLFKRLGGLEKPEAFQSWLFGITRRVVAAHRRKAWVRRWLPGTPPDQPDPAASPRRVSEQSQVAERVWAAIEALPAHHREVLVLCDLEERADSEVAEMLGVPKNTVKSRLRRARLGLRERLGDFVAELDAPLEMATGGTR